MFKAATIWLKSHSWGSPQSSKKVAQRNYRVAQSRVTLPPFCHLLVAFGATFFRCFKVDPQSDFWVTFTFLSNFSGLRAPWETRSLTNLYFASSPENVCEYFFVFAWEFCIGKSRGFLVNFLWSPFPTKRSTKTPQKIWGKFGEKSGAKSRTKIRKIWGTFVLNSGPHKTLVFLRYPRVSH